MNELLSPKQAAKMLGVSPGTLRNWEEAKKISSVKTLGKHRRYKLDEINKLLNESAESE
jgi:excisionase family DNA binding protein